MGWTGRSLCICLSLAILVAATAAAQQPRAGGTFPPHLKPLFLSGDRGDIGVHRSVLLLTPSVPSTQSTTQFVAPGVTILNVVNQRSNESWYTQESIDKDSEITSVANAVLYFQANAQALTVFELRLLTVHAGGSEELLATDSQQFVTALSPQPVTFFLNAQGRVLGEGDHLHLQVFSQTGNVAVLLQYGGATPSGLQGLQLRWLDSDGDGISDSDERADGTNPVDPSSFKKNPNRDSDMDGLSDAFERGLGTDSRKSDTDGDGFGDGVEVYAGTNPLDAASFPRDNDRDGLPDAWEIRYFNSTGLFGAHDDPDRDGCDNLCEASHGTNPNNADTDGDGVNDGDEINRGTDPLGTSVVSGTPDRRELQAGAGFFALTSILALFGIQRWKP